MVDFDALIVVVVVCLCKHAVFNWLKSKRAQTKFKDLELHITKFSKNSPYIFNQAESKKTNKIIDSNSNIIEDDIQEDN